MGESSYFVRSVFRLKHFNSMKVLFITHCVNMGGGNFSLLQLMKELSAPPYDIEPILLAPLDSPKNISSIIREAKANGIKCISTRFYQFKWETKSLLNYLRYFTNIFNYRRILRQVNRVKPDLIHSNSSVIDIGGFLASKLGIKHVWHLREFGDWDFDMKPLFGSLQERLVYKKSDQFIAISKSVKHRFLPFIKPASKITVIYNGLPINKSKKYNYQTTEDGMVKFCISGSLNPAKGQMDVLKAIDRLVNEDGIRNIHLYVLGEGPDRDKLEEFCRDYHISSFVTFTGWIKEVEKYYSQSQVGLMLSTNEAFGRVTIDYMREGMAIIASNSGANPELIEDKITGLLFPKGDIDALSKLMKELVENETLRCQLAQNAYEFSQNHFKSEDNTKAVYEVYKSLIQNYD